jgi:multidrug resistance efflux pump
MGTAQGLEADISSPRAGVLTELRVKPYQDVRKGDVIAVVEPASPDVTSNTLAVLKAEMEFIRLDTGYDGGDQVRYAQFQWDWMLEKADLVALQSQLAYAEKEYQRVAALVERKILEPSSFDIAKRDLDQARQAVELKSSAVQAAEKALQQLDPANAEAASPATVAALNLAAEKLRLAEAKLQPVKLVSPLDGRVSKIAKFPGATVADGEPILTVASQQVEYILGYVGQPLRVEPTPGMNVEVRSRGLHRAVGQALVTQVGPRIELFNAPLRIRGMGNAQQRGLPIVVTVPPEMKLRPGELVDLTLTLN